MENGNHMLMVIMEYQKISRCSAVAKELSKPYIRFKGFKELFAKKKKMY